jgi:membrane fusion protein (multidrug efflux system)
VDTQPVKAGDVLVILDDVDTNLALRRAEADFARAQADLERAKVDMDRRKPLASSGSVSGEELSNAKNAFKVAESAFNFAKAAKDQAQVNLERTIIRAPIDGIVARRQVQMGQKIMAGTPLLSIVPLTEVHVDANFKEVELRKVKVGQPVELTSDLYGSSVKYHGRVVGFSGGTGSAFALIPAQNATGNWIKVVQRLPVRIALKREELIKHPLQVGLSMYADINISE